jgi:hypothetical protein
MGYIYYKDTKQIHFTKEWNIQQVFTRRMENYSSGFNCFDRYKVVGIWQASAVNTITHLSALFFFSGVRQEQDIYVRLIDSVTKQVRTVKNALYIVWMELPGVLYICGLQKLKNLTPVLILSEYTLSFVVKKTNTRRQRLLKTADHYKWVSCYLSFNQCIVKLCLRYSTAPLHNNIQEKFNLCLENC